MGRKSGLIHQDRLPVDGLSILNHELGNVLNGLSGMAGLLRDSGLTDEQCRWLAAIEQSGRQMCRIMESTLNYRDGAETGFRAKLQRINGINMLEDVMISHAPAALAKGLDIVLVTDRDLPSCWQADRGLLGQLLDNLVGNAVKFTAAGHVMLKATAPDDGFLVLSVCDSGPGVRQQEPVFEPWRRSAATAPDHPGCGLGLYVCRRIVESLGGSLAVSQEPAGGARFDARIPTVFEDQQRSPAGITSLAGLTCRLELEPPMLCSVQSLLDRLGVGWRCGRRHRAGGMPRGKVIRIASGKACSDTHVQGILLSNSGSGSGEVFIASPVLESGLEQALFQLLLQQRYEGIRQSDMQG